MKYQIKEVLLIKVKAILHRQSFLAKMSAILCRVYATPLAVDTLGNTTQIEIILFVSSHPSWPRQEGVV